MRIVDGNPMVGTRHTSKTSRPQKLGVLILNFGQVPRAGIGDLAARCADAVAELVTATYRFDLPGLGDSPGSLPEREEPLFLHLQNTGHVGLVDRLIEELCREERVPGFVLVGMCATTWTAVYAAKSERIVGVVLLEPELRTTPPGPERTLDAVARLLGKIFSRHSWVRILHGETALGRRLRKVTSEGASRALVRSLPTDSHLPLVESWRQLAGRHLPMLVVTARRGWREVYVLALLRELGRGGRSSHIEHVRIPATNHIFTAGEGTAAVIDTTTRWFKSNFAPGGYTTSVLAAHKRAPSEP